MHSQLLATNDLVSRYVQLFVNRRAYTIQSFAPNSKKDRCYYYRPKRQSSLSNLTIRSHLEGCTTIGLYAINPATQRCKWVAIDADYSNALEDLLKLQWELKRDGVEAALEKSRRGGHLWIFAAEPLLARECRLYIQSLAHRLKVPIKGIHREQSSPSGRIVLADGIEIFPRQDELKPGEFGNAIRGPLGIHRVVDKRFWFYGADYTLEAQISYLCRLKRITTEEMSQFVSGITTETGQEHSSVPVPRHKRCNRSGRPEFSILEYIVGKKRRSGRNYFTRCPSCAERGRDKNGDNLAISVADPRKYKCWAGCTKEEIRAAVGCPITTSNGITA